MKTVSAYKARVNFGELINLVYYNGEDIIVERKGKPMVKITRVENLGKKDITAFRAAAGSWKDLDTDKLIKNIYKLRKDSSSKKKFLAPW